MKNHHNQIVCPECNSTFSIDESNYALIAEQVRNKEFNEELEKKVLILSRRLEYYKAVV